MPWNHPCRPIQNVTGSPGDFVLRTAATEDVSTTRLTLSLDLATLPSTFVVPLSAGSIRSRCGSSTDGMKGMAVWKT